MTAPIALVETTRGPFLENLHTGHIVICDSAGIVESWGNPDAIVLPRSSSKMLQALPLIESGAAGFFGLTTEHLALACASHNGAEIHIRRVLRWLDDLGLEDDDLRCGPQPSRDKELRFDMIRTGKAPCQCHNNCSGKHAGFLTLTKHLNAGSEYIDPDHPVQKACKEAFERLTGESTPGFGIDGCGAPNFATRMEAMARAMATFATAPDDSPAAILRNAMMAHPDLIAGQGRACTELMQACHEPVALKTGADGYFIAILPARGMGVALKISDGTTRASECAIAAVLVRLGVLGTAHPTAQKYLRGPIKNWRGVDVGQLRALV